MSKGASDEYKRSFRLALERQNSLPMSARRKKYQQFMEMNNLTTLKRVSLNELILRGQAKECVMLSQTVNTLSDAKRLIDDLEAEVVATSSQNRQYAKLLKQVHQISKSIPYDLHKRIELAVGQPSRSPAALVAASAPLPVEP